MSTQTEEQKSKENYRILNSYKIDDIEKPQIILRKFCNADNHRIDKDDLFVLSLDMTDSDEDLQKKLPDGFMWALQSLKTFKKTYQKMLAEPNERIHLEGIALKDSYIILESTPEKTSTNANSGEYLGGTAELNGRPCIMLVNGKIKDSTFLHEAVHHSDLMLSDQHFSDLPIYQTIIMLIDAQISSSGKNNKTVQSLRSVNKLYQPGQLYVEGLAWITEMSMTDLYQEKNHLGQSLKQLHATYTKAILEDKSAVLDCFAFFKPSSQLQLLLQAYNRNGQKIINNRKTILKQQQNFTNDILKFRKEIGTIDRTGLGNIKLPEGTMEFCNVCGFTSLTSAVTAYHKASELFNQTKDDFAVVIETLQKLQANIKPKNLTDLSLTGKDLLTSCFYLQLAEQQQNGLVGAFTLADIPESIKQKTPDEVRKSLYNGMNKDITQIALAYEKSSSKPDCQLAQNSKATPESVQSYLNNQKNAKTV